MSTLRMLAASRTRRPWHTLNTAGVRTAKSVSERTAAAMVSEHAQGSPNLLARLGVVGPTSPDRNGPMDGAYGGP